MIFFLFFVLESWLFSWTKKFWNLLLVDNQGAKTHIIPEFMYHLIEKIKNYIDIVTFNEDCILTAPNIN